jgi:hypothetical protein
MTMVHKLRSRAMCSARVAGRWMTVLLAWLGLAALLSAEPPRVHFNHAGVLTPGAIGSQRLQRGGPLPGYFQPVEVAAPAGAIIATAETGQFSGEQAAPVTVGLLIGSVYRLRVTGIPHHPGMEVYPTIEVIDRIYPPGGLEFKFPIPIELTQEELEMALDGKFVTRVIYLEEPGTAVPAVQQPGDQPYFEVGEHDSPLDMADTLGRPMAILRMGARVPDANGPDNAFLYGSPALLRWRSYAAHNDVSPGPDVVTSDLPVGPSRTPATAGNPFRGEASTR